MAPARAGNSRPSSLSLPSVPEDVSVSVFVDAEFTVTLPKARLAALTVSCGLDAAAPVPLNAIATELPEVELLLIVSWPETAPVALGLNCTVRVAD